MSARTWCKSEISKERAQKWGVLFIGIWIPAIVAFLLIKPDRDILQYLGTKPSGNNQKGLLFGLLIGFVLNGVCIPGAWLNQDILFGLPNSGIVVPCSVCHRFDHCLHPDLSLGQKT